MIARSTIVLLLCLASAQAQLVRHANTTIKLPSEPVLFSGYTTENALGTLSFSGGPLFVASPPGETNRLFVVEKNGRVQVITNLSTTPVKSEFLSLSAVTGYGGFTDDGECGLLSLAFHPNYATNGEFFVFYSVWQSGRLYQRIARMRVMAANPNRADHTFIQPLITQLDDAGNHNAGTIAFGPDGYLYISVGDEGGGGDTYNNGRFIDKGFHSAILRIDVDRKPGSLVPNAHAQTSPQYPSAVHAGTYTIPPDNPFIGFTSWHNRTIDPANVRTEIWATGLRNPFRFSFDPTTGRLFCADVGQGTYEEVNIITKGADGGWSWREGRHAFSQGPSPTTPPATGFTPLEPIFDYDHSFNASDVAYGQSITGGMIYRGRAMPELTGKYIFADYESGWIMSLEESGGNWVAQHLCTDSSIAGFGLDPRNGELLLCDLGGTVKRLKHTGAPATTLPATLSATGVFSNTATMTPAAGVVPYDVNLPFWSDYATKQRWFAIKSTTPKFGFSEQGNWTLPTGAVWVKHFDIEVERGNPATRRRLETRILVKTTTDVYGLSYQWREDQTDADLVDGDGLSYAIPSASPAQTWRFPSRSECNQCHTPGGGYALSFNTAQLNRPSTAPGVGHQLAAFHQAGYLDKKPAPAGVLPALAAANDSTHSLEQRARSYLSANCSMCHQPNGLMPSSWDARLPVSLNDTHLVNGAANDFGGDPLNRLIVPGDTAHSILLHRINATGGFARMPPLGSSELDPQGISLITHWINSNLTNTIDITTPPQGIAVSESDTATFSVVATGSGTLSYQWQKDRINVSGETGATLTIANATASDQAGYSVIVTDDNGSESSVGALLEVIGDPPRIVTQPLSQLAKVGDTISFNVSALGRPTLRHQWRKSNISIPGATGAAYIHSNVQLGHAGSYNVLVGGKALSQSVLLTVIGEAVGNRNIIEGTTATLAVPYAGSLPVFAWRKGSDPAIISTAAKLTISRFSSANEEDYFCDVTAHGTTKVLGPYHLHRLLTPSNSHAAPPIDATVSGDFVWQLTADEPATTFVVGKLPAGLVYSALTNRITGTPNVSGAFTLRITPKNAAGTGPGQDYTITIAPFDFASGINHEALVEPQSEVNDNLGGRVSLSTAGTGALTGRLFHGVTSYPIGGRWLSRASVDPTFRQTIPRRNETPLELALQIDRSSGQLSGTLTEGAFDTTILGDRLDDWSAVPASALRAFAVSYYHTALLPSGGDAAKPQGSGYLRLRGSTSGLLSGSGRLPDGSSITTSLQGKDPRLIWYLPLYAGKGSLLGRLASFSLNATVIGGPAFSGTVEWRKLAALSTTDRTYAAPFALTLRDSGYLYKAPASGFNVLGTSDAPDNAALDFNGADVSSAAQAGSLNQLFRLNTSSIASFTAALNPTGMKLSINRSAGVFSGSFLLMDGLVKRPVSYYGILVNEEGHGYFLLPGIPTATTPILSGGVHLHRQL